MKQDRTVWQLNFFGGLRASRQDRVVERFRTQKTAALLALLALKGTRSREDVCALLWPDSSPEAARNSLSAALSSLRRELGDDNVCADRLNVALAPASFQTDVALFNDALKSEDFARAVELYRGHLLPGLHEDPFPAIERELQEKARRAFIARIEELEENGQCTEALELTRRAISLFGDDERWFLALMRAHYGLADLDAALRAYDSLCRFARKNGETASESARLLAKTIRRDKEREALTPPTAPVARKTAAPEPQSEAAYLVSAPATLPSPPPSAVPTRPEVPAPTTPYNNLPTLWTRFFGREGERSMLGAWLRDGEKLVTLSGAGGSGKTRLSLETLRELAPDWDGDILFVPLAALSDPDLILPAIRDALHLIGTPDLSPLEQLERALRGRRAILFLDNFEQLVEGGAARLQSLRERLPQTTFLVTSRVLLQLPGEREFPVSPLPTPLQNTAPAQVRECASAALFCDRAGLTLDQSNADAVGALCRRLDGIPLALELAAARARVLSPAQILERLQKHPDFLQSRELGIPARHKTLRATIEWSTELLPPEHRAFWTRLSLFHGGWTLEAAEKIAAPGICEDWETLDWLTLLRDCSLLFIDERGEEPRFRMLQTLREFGREQLQDAESVERAFFDFFLDFAQHGSSAMQGPGQTVWLARLDAEQDNLRAALAWAREHEPERGLLLATALIDFWETRLSLDEGRSWIETFLRATNTGTNPAPQTKPLHAPDLDARARALSGAGRMASHSIELAESRALVEQGLQVARQSESTSNLVYAVASFVRFAMTSGDAETDLIRARELALESLHLARDSNDKTLLLEALVSLNYARISLLDTEGLRATNVEAIALARELKDQPRLSHTLSALAHIAYLEKQWDEANELLSESTALARQLNATWELLEALWIHSNVAREQGRLDIAREAILEEWRMCHDNPTLLWARALNMTAISYLLLREGDAANAVRLLGAEEALREASGFQIAPVLRLDYNRYCAEARRVLGESRFELLWKEGSSLSPQLVMDEALGMGIAPNPDPDAQTLMATRARALSGAGRMASHSVELDESRSLIEQGLQVARQSGSTSNLVYAVASFVRFAMTSGDAETDLVHARELAWESLRLARQSKDKSVLLEALVSLNLARISLLDMEGLRATNVEAIALARELKDEARLSHALTGFAHVAYLEKQWDEANELLAESTALARQSNFNWDLLEALWIHANVAREQGRLDITRNNLTEEWAVCRDNPALLWGHALNMMAVGYLLLREGDAANAVRLLGAEEALREASGFQIAPVLRLDYNRYCAEARRVLGESRFQLLWKEGRSLSPQQVMDEALGTGISPNPDPNAQTLIATRARALSGAGRFAFYASDLDEAGVLLQQGLETARMAGNSSALVHATRSSALAATAFGEAARARELGRESVRLARESGDRALLLKSLLDLGFAELNVSEFGSSETICLEAIALARREGNERALAMALTTLAIAYNYLHRYDDARVLLAESQPLARRQGAAWELMVSTALLGHISSVQGQHEVSRAAYKEAIDMTREFVGESWTVVNMLLSVAYAFFRRGDVRGCVRIMGACEALAESINYELMPFLLPDYKHFQAASRQALGESEFLKEWHIGRQWTPEQMMNFAQSEEPWGSGDEANLLTTTSIPASDEILAARARALSGAGRLAWYASDMEEAGTLLQQGLDAARQIGDTQGILYASRGLMRTSATQGDSSKAIELARESLALARASGDTSLLIKALLDQAFADVNVGELASASALSSEATVLARQLGDEAALSLALNIGAVAGLHDDRDSEALVLIYESEEVARRVGSVWDLIIVLSLKGHCLSRLGEHVPAQEAVNECVALARTSFSESWTIANILLAASYGFMRRGEVRDGAQILGAGEAMRDRIGYTLMPVMVANHERFIAFARQTLGEAAFESARRSGAAMTPDEVFNFVTRPLSSVPSPPPSKITSDETLSARSRALSGAGRLAWHDSDLEASRALVLQGLEAARKAGDTASFVYAVSAFVRFAMVTGDLEGVIAQSRILSQEAVARSRQAGDKTLLLDSLTSFCYANSVSSRYQESYGSCEEAIALARELGDEASLVRVLTIQASFYYHYQNNPAPARVLLEECTELCRRLNSPWDRIAALWLLSGVLRQQGELERAGEVLAEVVEIYRANPSYRWSISHILMMSSYLFVEQGDLQGATRLMAASEALSEALGYHPTPNLLPEYERYKAKARELLGEEAFAEAWESGRLLTAEAAMELMLQQEKTPSSAPSAHSDETLAARSRALSGAGRLAWHGSDLEASRLLVNQGLSAARESGDTASFVYAVAAFVRFAMVTGDLKGVIAQSRFLSEEAVARSRRVGDKALLLDSLISLGYANIIVSQFQEAYAANEEAIALARELGDDTSLVRCLNNQASVYYHQGIYPPARIILEESEALCRRLNSIWDLISARWTLSSVAREQGDLELADDAISEVLEICRANPSFRWGVANVLMTMSHLFVERGALHNAVCLMAASQSISERLGYHPVPVLLVDLERYKARARELLSEDAFAAAWEEGHVLTVEAAIELALER